MKSDRFYIKRLKSSCFATREPPSPTSPSAAWLMCHRDNSNQKTGGGGKFPPHTHPPGPLRVFHLSPVGAAKCSWGKPACRVWRDSLPCGVAEAAFTFIQSAAIVVLRLLTSSVVVSCQPDFCSFAVVWTNNSILPPLTGDTGSPGMGTARSVGACPLPPLRSALCMWSDGWACCSLWKNHLGCQEEIKCTDRWSRLCVFPDIGIKIIVGLIYRLQGRSCARCQEACECLLGLRQSFKQLQTTNVTMKLSQPERNILQLHLKTHKMWRKHVC